MRSEKNPSWNGGCYDTKTEAEERLKQVEKFKHMKGGAMNREGGLPKTEEELKNYYCPECGEDSEIVFEPTPFISEITPYVCVSCGKNVIPVDRRTDKQIDVWKYWQHGEEVDGGTEKDMFVRVNKEGAMKATKYALVILRDSREDVLAEIKKSDPGAKADPEGSPVRMWVTTILRADELTNIPGVQDAIESMDKGGTAKGLIARIDRVIKLGSAERVFAADEPEEDAEEQAEEGEEVLIETEEDAESIHEEAEESAMDLLDRIIEFCIKEAGNPPAWVKNPAIWEKAKKAVEPYKAKQENFFSTVAYVYEKMGGEIK